MHTLNVFNAQKPEGNSLSWAIWKRERPSREQPCKRDRIGTVSEGSSIAVSWLLALSHSRDRQTWSCDWRARARLVTCVHLSTWMPTSKTRKRMSTPGRWHGKGRYFTRTLCIIFSNLTRYKLLLSRERSQVLTCVYTREINWRISGS